MYSSFHFHPTKKDQSTHFLISYNHKLSKDMSSAKTNENILWEPIVHMEFTIKNIVEFLIISKSCAAYIVYL